MSSDRQALMDRIASHYRERMGNIRVIEVPEWGDDGQPLLICVWPASLLELQQINRRGGPNANSLEILVETLIVRAKDKDHRPIFTVGDRPRLMRESDPDVVVRVVSEINEDMPAEAGQKAGEGPANP